MNGRAKTRHLEYRAGRAQPAACDPMLRIVRLWWHAQAEAHSDPAQLCWWTAQSYRPGRDIRSAPTWSWGRSWSLGKDGKHGMQHQCKPCDVPILLTGLTSKPDEQVPEALQGAEPQRLPSKLRHTGLSSGSTGLRCPHSGLLTGGPYELHGHRAPDHRKGQLHLRVGMPVAGTALTAG